MMCFPFRACLMPYEFYVYELIWELRTIQIYYGTSQKFLCSVKRGVRHFT